MIHLALILSLLLSAPRVVNYNSADGLPSNTVYAIAQDADGALLVGTRGGLSRFDGERFQTLIPGKRINALTVDPQNRIWAGTTEGLQVVEMPGQTVSEAYRGGNIRALLTDSDGYVWATMGDSLLVKLSFSAHSGIREESNTRYSKRYSEGDYLIIRYSKTSKGRFGWAGGSSGRNSLQTGIVPSPDSATQKATAQAVTPKSAIRFMPSTMAAAR